VTMLSLISRSAETGLIIVVVALFAARLTLPRLKSGVVSKLVITVFALLFLLNMTLWGSKTLLLQDAFRLDHFALFFKGFFLLAGIFIFMIAGHFQDTLAKRIYEFYSLFTLATLGACFLVSANNFLVLFLSIELITFSLYVLTTYWRTQITSIEAGTKYLVVGAFSSAMMLFGISFIYGTTQTINFHDCRSAFTVLSAQPSFTLLHLGLILVLAGIGFKISAFPFQLWAPDVYQGAPTPVTAFLAVVSKSAGFAALMRLVLLATGGWNAVWILMLALIAAATLLYGNLGAIPQLGGNMKRFLAFSGIGHAGYLLMAMICQNAQGYQALIYYLVVYAIATLTIFLGIVLTDPSQSDMKHNMSDFQGLLARSPMLGFSFFVAILSLAGVPPMAGFFGKFLVIQAVIEKGMWLLALIGAVTIAISLYYYLNVIKLIYADQPNDTSSIKIGFGYQLTFICLNLSLIFLGVFQAPLLHLIAKTI